MVHVMSKTDSDKRKTSRPASSKPSNGKPAGNKDAAGKFRSGKDAAGKSSAGKTGAGKTGTGKVVAGKAGAGKAVAGKSGSGKAEFAKTSAVGSKAGDNAAEQTLARPSRDTGKTTRGSKANVGKKATVDAPELRPLPPQAKGDKLLEDEKVQKVLARSGLGSRREMEVAISAGRVKVNGKVAQLGDRIGPHHQVSLDDRPQNLKGAEESARRVIMYNKPEGELCTRKDPEGRRTVFERLPRLKGERWIAIGRLDINTSGLLLFTTDGELANRLMHPSTQIEREYAVRVMGEVKREHVVNMVSGVMLEDGPARFTDVQEFGGEGINSWFHVVIMEGRNREVRRLWDSQGLTVSRLKRVRYGTIFLDKRARAGEWVELEQSEIDELSTMSGLEHRKAPALTPDEQNRWSRDKQKRRPVRAMKKPPQSTRKPR